MVEVECLGACANAPMVQINDDLLRGPRRPSAWPRSSSDLRAGKDVAMGSQTGRQGSAPEGGPRL